MLLHIIIYLILGLSSGILAGLLGIGGGIILVPSLYFLFKYLDMSFIHPMHQSIGTSIAIILIASLASMYLYQKRNAIFWPIFKDLTPSLIVGSIVGVIINNILPGKIVGIVFAVFAFLFGLYFLFIKKIHQNTKPPKKYQLYLGGLIIGVLATLLGIGGGVIAIPFFIMLFRCPNYCLIGNASVATFITSAVGTIGYIISGFNIARHIHSIGNIYIPAFLFILKQFEIKFLPPEYYLILVLFCE